MKAYIFSTLPSLLLLTFFYLNDRFKEPKLIVFKTFLLGYAISFFLYPFIIDLDNFFEDLFQNSPNLSYLDFDFISNFIRASFLEETSKFLIIYLFVIKYTEFDEPMDAIVYGVAVSLGFSAMENYGYISNESDLSLIHITYNRLWPTVMHMCTGIMMGFLFSKYFFSKINNFYKLYLVLLIPMIIHGFYNFTWLWSAISFGTYIISYVFTIMLVSTCVGIFIYEKKMQVKNIWLDKSFYKVDYGKASLAILLNLITVIIITYIVSNVFFPIY